MQDSQEVQKEKESIEARFAKLETKLDDYANTNFFLVLFQVNFCIFFWVYVAWCVISCVEYDEDNQLRVKECRPAFRQIYRPILVLLRDFLSRLIDDLRILLSSFIDDPS